VKHKQTGGVIMLLDKKSFWYANREICMDEKHALAQSNTSIVKSEKVIEKLLENCKSYRDELEEEYLCLINDYSTLAYTQGLQDGAKMTNLLLSGEAINHMQRVQGEKFDKNNINWQLANGGL